MGDAQPNHAPHESTNSWNGGGQAAYCRQVLRQAGGGLCGRLGLEKAALEALETLTDVVEQFLRTVGETSHVYAEQGGRTQGSVMDVVMAFGDLDIDLYGIYEYIWANPVEVLEIATPNFPVPAAKSHDHIGFVLADIPRKARPANVLPFMPPLPPNYTYVHSPIFAYQEKDEARLRLRQAEERLAVCHGLSSFVVQGNLVPSKTFEENGLPVITWPLAPNHLDHIRAQDGVNIEPMGLGLAGSMANEVGAYDNFSTDENGPMDANDGDIGDGRQDVTGTMATNKETGDENDNE